MSEITRRLLIVEDDQFYNRTYTMHCEEVLGELSHVRGTVRQAFSYAEAKRLLESEPIDFVSVDIALSQEERGKTDQERQMSEAGGMALLKEMQGTTRPPLAVIVSGETLLSYAIDAYKEYSILAYYQKDRFNIDEYKHAIKAALYYLDAIELIEKPEIEAAAASWHQALESARIAGIKEQQFPVPLEEKLEARWTHSVTGLPVGRWTEENLRNRVVERKDWAIIRVTLAGFSEFVSKFASQEESILTFVGKLLRRVGSEFQPQECFVGHLGHLTFPNEPSFVVILGGQGVDRAPQIAAWLKSEFAKIDGIFVPTFEEKIRPHDLDLALEMTVLNGSTDFFEDLHRLLDSLGSNNR